MRAHMRAHSSAGLALTVAAALAFATPALAQSPFSIRSSAAEQPSSPVTQQRIAEDEATVVSPDNPQTRTNVPAAVATTPAPFDINEDGRSPVVELPEEEQEFFRPSTTTSPLARGREPTAVVPIDAISEDQRRDLTRLLKQDAGTVRELRVNVENDQTWVDSVVDRPIVPYRTLRLDGEIDFRSWTVFLSASEAARGGTLSIAFTNSVLVLPEASRLRVFLNGRQIAQTAIDSPDRTKVIALPVSSELLRPGENAIRLEAEMRHRIDCSLDATYELWTRIDTRLTGFSFTGGRIPLSGLNDLPAVGVGTNGATRLRVVQRQGTATGNIDRMLRAVQAASLRGRFAQPLVEVVDTNATLDPAPGVLNIVIGPYDVIRTVSPDIPREGSVGPITTLIDPPGIGATVVITGPSERDVDAALTRFDAPALPDQPQSSIAATPPWLVPDSVRINGAATVTLRQAGVETINFSGRRFSTNFQVTLPPDFYAAAYGEARLLLDAAYSADVQPGSRLTVLVNGVLSTAISFTSSSGEVFEKFPIVLVMQNFRPGINNIEIVVELNTAADQACLPGGTVPARDRFALFSSTRLVFPNFARIGQLPNLASFTTNGFPYQLSSEPVRVRVGGEAPDTVGAAGTLISRVAVSRGASFPTNVIEEVAPFGDTGVIVVAPLQDTSNLTLDTTGAANVVPATWLQPGTTGASPAEPAGLERYDDVLRRLRQQLRQEEVRLDRSSAAELTDRTDRERSLDQRNETQRTRERWFEELSQQQGLTRLINDAFRSLRDSININLDLNFGEEEDEFAAPVLSEGASLIIAQAASPNNSDAAWTLITAPTAGLLSTSMAAVTSSEIWTRIGGRMSAYDLENNSVQVVPADQVSYLATVPLSFTNLRLIAANWFSINNGVYAVALVIMALVLGIVTWALITPLGRHND
ncbi:cellulose biosynthesis cyclic di-GMP-binding regulatory protein BcsB [Acuticoccus mangrovi]|uniref:Cyclic di-GMP-binding protein n=1 Tax=Acuticoccus mangrovi TaxID=2796142 RepID=A0A934IJ80_9HYPH|nr:cellulose biosynthesis cyclic di-GMP-binding regulatory protein BcsB [Acuticoccus mangrovi]MBJ3777694.1 cellulose biosynthesis cyclic di-GMP-binding regulatory protein BcsB [Acuticoccus mangrovi]